MSVSQNYVLRHGNRFVRSRLMPKSSAFRHSRIYRWKIRGACPRIFRIFIEIGLRPKSLMDFCDSLKGAVKTAPFCVLRALFYKMRQSTGKCVNHVLALPETMLLLTWWPPLHGLNAILRFVVYMVSKRRRFILETAAYFCTYITLQLSELGLPWPSWW